jgi:hypothetical protein
MASRDEDAARIDDPAPGGVGLLIVDMINSMAFEGAENVRADANAACDVCTGGPDWDAGDLRQRQLRPVTFRQVEAGRGLFKASLRGAADGQADDPTRRRLFRHQTSGLRLLRHQPAGLLLKLGVDRLVLTGVAADICILSRPPTRTCVNMAFGFPRRPRQRGRPTQGLGPRYHAQEHGRRHTADEAVVTASLDRSRGRLMAGSRTGS